jgi:hypothetical protein
MQAGSSPSGEIHWRSGPGDDGSSAAAAARDAAASGFTFRRMLSGDGARLSRLHDGSGGAGSAHAALTGPGLRELERQLRLAHARPEPTLAHIAEARDVEQQAQQGPLDVD